MQSIHGKFALGAWDNESEANEGPMYLGIVGDSWTATDPGYQIEEADIRLFNTPEQAKNAFQDLIKSENEEVWILSFDTASRPVCHELLHKGKEFRRTE